MDLAERNFLAFLGKPLWLKLNCSLEESSRFKIGRKKQKKGAVYWWSFVACWLGLYSGGNFWSDRQLWRNSAVCYCLPKKIEINQSVYSCFFLQCKQRKSKGPEDLKYCLYLQSRLAMLITYSYFLDVHEFTSFLCVFSRGSFVHCHTAWLCCQQRPSAIWKRTLKS